MPYGKELTKQWKKLGYLDGAFWPRPRPPRRRTAAPSPRPSFPGGALSRRAAPPCDLPPPAAARKRRQAVVDPLCNRPGSLRLQAKTCCATRGS